MNTKDFIKKRNEEFERISYPLVYSELITDKQALEKLRTFHSASLDLFAEEIKKEIEKIIEWVRTTKRSRRRT